MAAPPRPERGAREDDFAYDRQLGASRVAQGSAGHILSKESAHSMFWNQSRCVIRDAASQVCGELARLPADTSRTKPLDITAGGKSPP